MPHWIDNGDGTSTNSKTGVIRKNTPKPNIDIPGIRPKNNVPPSDKPQEVIISVNISTEGQK